MKLLIHNRTEPSFNLACEEYFLARTDLELDIFWRNTPVVVIGRNQDAEAETDGAYRERHGIGLIRRITGGGAVYHDLGNICYTHIRRYGGPVDFRRFAAPMVSALRALGVDAAFAGRNDILAGGRKISGTAQTIRKGRALHHGTILYDVDLERLAGALRVGEEKYKGRGIASVAARVANVRPMLADGPEPEDFIGRLAKVWECSGRYEMSGGDLAEIESLRREVYESPEWNLHKKRL